MNNRTAIEVQGLYHHFDTTSILENVCFEVNKGEFIGIFGPNGGGKTAGLGSALMCSCRLKRVAHSALAPGPVA